MVDMEEAGGGKRSQLELPTAALFAVGVDTYDEARNEDDADTVPSRDPSRCARAAAASLILTCSHAADMAED